MPYRDLPTPDPIGLPQPVADRLLARASELDASYRARAAVLDLRAAATEAGISERAFDAAYAELQRDAVTPPDVQDRPPQRSRRWGVAIAALALTAVGVAGTSGRSRVDGPHRTVIAVPPAADMPVIEDAIVLRCLSPDQAAGLIAPLLDGRADGMVYTAPNAPRVLRIRATPPMLAQVKSVLDAYEQGGGSCMLPPHTRRTW